MAFQSRAKNKRSKYDVFRTVKNPSAYLVVIVIFDIHVLNCNLGVCEARVEPGGLEDLVCEYARGEQNGERKCEKVP
jgi:hypothetical protein